MRKERKMTGIVWIWIAILVFLIDRFTKTWVLHHIVPFDPVAVLPFFNFTLAYNTGAAFSFLHGASGWQNYLLGGLALCVSGLIVYWLNQISSRLAWTCIALNLVLGGALGNLWDRIRYGYVIDFLDFHLGDWHFAVFNVADSAICVGAFILMFDWLVKSRKV